VAKQASSRAGGRGGSQQPPRIPVRITGLRQTRVRLNAANDNKGPVAARYRAWIWAALATALAAAAYAL